MVSQVNDFRSAAAGASHQQQVIARPAQKTAALPDNKQPDPLRLSQTLTPEHTRQHSLIQRAQHKVAASRVAETSLNDIGKNLAQLSKRVEFALRAGSASPKIAGEIEQLASRMEQRLQQASYKDQPVLSRQLKPVFHGESRTAFQIRGLDTKRSSPRDETLIFNLAKGGANAVPVKLGANTTPEQQAVQFRQALNEHGIGVALNKQRQLVFSANEADWQHLSQKMRVVGQGDRFPAGQPNRVKLETTESRFEPLTWQTDKEQLRQTLVKSQQMMKQIKASIQELKVHNQDVMQRIDTINQRNHYLNEQVLGSIETDLSRILPKGDSFSSAFQNLKAQANVHRQTVVSLLSQ
ncbi:hypothetical protein RJ45_14750 [Photobacterium gaetbulicola]|uniref:Flagellin n=1 Tax=Photobacterium gaetbulicola TaxID=1295392 RepID=A0A0B9G2A0_9GAMM|nr:hypothetical protein [Photobacterium gaetbulicola]KHT62898.1 hypothetical protein RJ45_14750 [Photobacterium gaetbulicola]